MSYSQRGGFLARPYRYFNPNATPFQPCNSCDGINKAPPQQGGSHVRPYRYFNPDATPFNPCGCGGGQQARRMESSNMRDFKGNAYYNDFPAYPVTGQDIAQDYSGTGCTGEPGCGCPMCRQHGNLINVYNAADKVAQVKYYQTGGFPVGAQLEVFNEGNEPLKYNYNLNDNHNGLPMFEKIAESRFLKPTF